MPSASPDADVLASDRYKSEYADNSGGSWDEIVDWNARRDAEGRFFIDRLRERRVRSVCDVAAGTGFHATILAQAGFEVTVVDGSPEMIAVAEANLRRAGLSLPVLCCDWRSLHDLIESSRFDAVICLGNSLAHIFDKSARIAVLGQFWRLLRPGGVLVLDHRNYDALRWNTRHQHSSTYCCCRKGARIDVELIDAGQARITYRSEAGKQRQILTFPLATKELCRELADVGFSERTTYADLSETQAPDSAEFLVHVCSKP